MMKYLFAAALLVASSVPFAQAADDSTGVTLGGIGTIKAKPDIAHVTLAVVSQGKTAAMATLDNSRTMKKLCAAIEGYKIDTKDIQTTGFSVTPSYDYPKDQERRLVGYSVSNYLVVHVRDIDVLGKMLDSAITSGANRVHGVVWDVSNRTELMDAARKAAFADAKRKALLYATAGGFKLHSVRNLSEQSDYRDEGERGGTYLRSLNAPGRADERPAVAASPGEITIKVVININWSIE